MSRIRASDTYKNGVMSEHILPRICDVYELMLHTKMRNVRTYIINEYVFCSNLCYMRNENVICPNVCFKQKYD